MQPYSKFAEPYDHNYIQTNVYSGAARDIPDPDQHFRKFALDFLDHREKSRSTLRSANVKRAELAIDEANARGGYGGKPFRLLPRNDYDNWQANAVYGEDRPTTQEIWGSASNQAVKMIYDDKDWAISLAPSVRNPRTSCYG